MNATIESRKIDLVQCFLNLDNVDIISKIENLLLQEGINNPQNALAKKLDYNNFQLMLQLAEKDFEKGNVYTTDQVHVEIDGWK